MLFNMYTPQKLNIKRVSNTHINTLTLARYFSQRSEVTDLPSFLRSLTWRSTKGWGTENRSKYEFLLQLCVDKPVKLFILFCLFSIKKLGIILSFIYCFNRLIITIYEIYQKEKVKINDYQDFVLQYAFQLSNVSILYNCTLA